jgi:hypothetical protein
MTEKITDVQVIPWEAKDSSAPFLWGVSYRLGTRLIARSVGTRSEADQYAASLKTLGVDKYEPDQIQ